MLSNEQRKKLEGLKGLIKMLDATKDNHITIAQEIIVDELTDVYREIYASFVHKEKED